MSATFEGASVLVTGGSRGIGKEIALSFARHGARRVAIGYFRNDHEAEATGAELGSLGTEPILLRGNIADPARVAAMLERVGPLDVIVANAATGVIRKVVELDEKHWDWTMNANARSIFTVARLAAATMEPGSSIIALSSLGSTRVLDNYALVGVSKAALEALMRYLAVELAPRGIRANAVSAGLVDTGALDHFPDREGMLAYYRERTPAGRLVEPADVAAAVLFLASPSGSMIRGQTLVLDGGYCLVT